MTRGLRFLTVFICVTATASLIAQQSQHYKVPRTEYGHPDIQGAWATAFLTMMERMPGVGPLVLSPEEARGLVEKMVANRPALVDPDALIHDIRTLAVVKGEYRTSIVVDPTDGKIPFSPAGLALSTQIQSRDKDRFDNIEDRPLAERCLENLGYAPMRSVPVVLPRFIVQTHDEVLIFSEDSSGPRIIHVGAKPRPETARSVGGYSVGRWEGDTLVVETTRFRADYPARAAPGRLMVISPNTKVVERFARVSPTELFYRFTVEDADLYTQPWSGEFSMTRFDQPLYEYACHEGNHSLPNALSGQRVIERTAATK